MTTPNKPRSDPDELTNGIESLFAPKDIHQLLLGVNGAFSHLQLTIDEFLAPAFFQRRVPKAKDFLLDRVVRRIRDEERTKLVKVIAAELGCDAELDDFTKTYNDVKDLRDTVSHAARIRTVNPDTLLITDTYLAENLDNITVQRAQLNEALRKCRYLEAQILYILLTTGLYKNFKIAGAPSRHCQTTQPLQRLGRRRNENGRRPQGLSAIHLNRITARQGTQIQTGV